MAKKTPWKSLGISALLTVAAVQHFRKPKFYYPVIPDSLSTDKQGQFALFSRAEWVALSGVAELGLAAALLVPWTRKLSATLSAGMFAGFTVAHISHLQRALGPLSENADSIERAVHKQKAFALARLPLQVPLVWIAWRARREA